MAVTGPLSPEWGPRTLNFMKVWEKQVNARGGVFAKEFNAGLPLEFLIYGAILMAIGLLMPQEILNFFRARRRVRRTA